MYSCVLCLLPFSGLPITVALISSQRISAGGVAERGFIVGWVGVMLTCQRRQRY
jgi:hypothetical protein